MEKESGVEEWSGGVEWEEWSVDLRKPFLVNFSALKYNKLYKIF